MQEEEFTRFFHVLLSYFVDFGGEAERYFVESVQNLFEVDGVLAQEVVSDGGEHLGGAEGVLSVRFGSVAVFQLQVYQKLHYHNFGYLLAKVVVLSDVSVAGAVLLLLVSVALGEGRITLEQVL